MKFLLKVLFGLFVFVLLSAIAGLILPKKYKFVVTDEVNVSPVIVYDKLSDFKNWDNWSPLIRQDSTVEVEFGKKTRGQQAKMQLKSRNREHLDLTITHSANSESVAINFDYNSKSKTTGLWFIEQRGEGCLINCTYNFTNLSYFERYFAFFNRSKLKTEIKESLKELAAVSLELKYSRLSEISVLNHPAIPSVIMVDSVKPEEEAARGNRMISYVKRFLERRELKPVGEAFKLIYGEVNDTLTKFAIGFPLEERTWVWRTLRYLELPDGQTLTVMHYGNPKNISKAHKELLDLMDEKNYALNGTPWEVHLYKFDTVIKDTSLFRTQVYYPVK